MARSRRRFKKTNPVVRTGVPKKRKAAKPEALVLPGTSESREWILGATQTANYKALGLASDPNFKTGRDATVQSDKFEPALQEEEEIGSEDDETRAALGQKRKYTPSVPLRKLTKMQLVYVRQMAKVHGEDFKAMARDIKVNRMQHSEGALKLLFARYHAHEKELLC